MVKHQINRPGPVLMLTHTLCTSDNNMINGSKLLNLTGISRGRRDRILRDIENSVVIRVGAMHIKGVW